jgi:hypothetical protein
MPTTPFIPAFTGPRAWFLPFSALLTLAACLFEDAGTGVGAPYSVDATSDTAVLDAMSPRPDAALMRPSARDAAVVVPIVGPPQQMGCSDGSREGFLDASDKGWNRIAGCGGAWTIPGILKGVSLVPQCNRQSGNTGQNLLGVGCSAADLCAGGWHLCEAPGDVAASSPSDCEGAVPADAEGFFAAVGGAAPIGACAVVLGYSNDVHGCGTFGQPEVETCFPLDRRLDFSDCAASDGLWQCGAFADHFNEAARVVKLRPENGGVLCCRDR